MIRLMKKRKFAVTLFELLVVILVTSILTVIFVLSSRRVLVTSKISKVKEEHKVLMMAISHYQVDFNATPSNEMGLKALNNSTKYITSIPHDPFSPGQSFEYLYLSRASSKVKYIIVSAGPDGDVDLMQFFKQVSQQVFISAESQEDSLDKALQNLTYDPTNGVNSNGDIVTIVPAY
jgi:type II secretory pathway pseudopilin PulG